MKKILSILLVFVMIGLVAVSGCADTAEEGTNDEAVVDEEATSENVTVNETIADSNETSEEVVDGENVTTDENVTVVEDVNSTVVAEDEAVIE